MKTLRFVFSVTCLLVPLFVMDGCDIVNDDPSVKEISATAYTFAGKPTIINTSSFGAGDGLRAHRDVSGEYGSVNSLEDGKYIVYTPALSFAGKEETLHVALSGDRTLDLTVKSLDDGAVIQCEGLSGIYDYAEITPDTELVIDLLDNDVFCGIGYNGGIISGVAVEGIGEEDYLLTLGPGRSATFRFAPAPTFKGKVKVIYNLGINWIEGSGFESKSEEEILSNPKKYLTAFTTSMVEVDVKN